MGVRLPGLDEKEVVLDLPNSYFARGYKNQLSCKTGCFLREAPVTFPCPELKPPCIFSKVGPALIEAVLETKKIPLLFGSINGLNFFARSIILSVTGYTGKVRHLATIRDVASEAGVSVATVSRVLNGKGYVNENTRKAVEAAIRKLAYKPNEVARSLYHHQSKLIGLVIPDITNPFFPEIARGVEDFFQEEGYHVMIGNSDESREKEVNYIEAFSQHNVMGIISTSSDDISQWAGLDIPVVLLDRIQDDFPSVCADQEAGGKLAAQILLERGSRNITLMRGPHHLRTAQERFLAALTELGRSSARFQVLNTAFSYHHALETAKQLFDCYPDTDGIIAANDMVAAAVLREALARGKKIPDELQIIGFDDIPISQLVYPALSTIHQPAYEMGMEAAKLLLDCMHQQTNLKKKIKLPIAFKDRETTRKAGG